MENSLIQNNFNPTNIQNKIFTNLNLENIKFGDTNLNLQIESLKEKIRSREVELFEIIKNQKLEYEKIAQEKDIEISKLVEKLISENDDLKKQVLDLEIEREFYKETLNDYKQNNEFIFYDEANNTKENNIFNNSKLNYSQILTNAVNPSADRLFFQSIKYINEVFESKRLELDEKYQLINYNFIKEKSSQLNSLKKFNLREFLNKFSHNREEIEDSLIPFELLEDQFLLFENKIKILFEDLKNKETQILISENKHDLAIEENRALKRKFNEEKKFLLIKIHEVKAEHEKIHKQIISKLEEEIRQKKVTLEKRVNDALIINENISQNLLKEKNEISEKLRNAEKKYWLATQDLETSEKERNNFEEMIFKLQLEIEPVNEELRKLQEEHKLISAEFEIVRKAKEDLLEKLKEANFKINSLEEEKKNLLEKLILKVKENEKLFKDNDNILKNQTERLNKQILEQERKTGEINYNNEKLTDFKNILEKKIENDNEIIFKLNNEIEKLKLELNEIQLKNKNLLLSLEENRLNIDRSNKQKIQFELDIAQKDEKLKQLRESFQKTERDLNNKSFEVEKLIKIKKDLTEESIIIYK